MSDNTVSSSSEAASQMPQQCVHSVHSSCCRLELGLAASSWLMRVIYQALVGRQSVVTTAAEADNTSSPPTDQPGLHAAHMLESLNRLPSEITLHHCDIGRYFPFHAHVTNCISLARHTQPQTQPTIR